MCGHLCCRHQRGELIFRLHGIPTDKSVQPYPCPGDADIQCCVPSSGGGGGSSGNLPGLDATQSGNARTILAVGKSKGFPIKGCEVAIATAIVESNVHVYANSAVAGSESCPYDKGFVG